MATTTTVTLLPQQHTAQQQATMMEVVLVSVVTKSRVMATMVLVMDCTLCNGVSQTL